MPTIQKSMRSPSLVARHAEALVLVGERARQGDLERRLGELGHRQRDVGERRAFLDVEHAEPLERQLARDAQRGDERRALGLQPFDDGDDRRAIRQPGRQQGELVRVATTHALHEAAVHRERHVTNRCRMGSRHERRAGGLGTHRSPGVCARLNRPARRVDAVSVAAVRAGRRSDRHRNALPSGATLSSCLRSRPPVPPASPPAAPDRRGGRPCDRPCAPCCG